jgi:hypothetical protein
MSNLTNKIIAYLGRTPDFLTEIKLENKSDGKGDYIAEWNAEDKVKPTEEQLNALDSDATKLENNNIAIAKRKELYGSTAKQLEYIVENGVDAFVTRQQQIKTENPKS